MSKVKLSLKKKKGVVTSEIVKAVRDLADQLPDEIIHSVERMTNNQVRPEKTELKGVDGWKVFSADPKQIESAKKHKVMMRIQAEYPALFSSLMKRERK